MLEKLVRWLLKLASIGCAAAPGLFNARNLIA